MEECVLIKYDAEGQFNWKHITLLHRIKLKILRNLLYNFLPDKTKCLVIVCSDEVT